MLLFLWVLLFSRQRQLCASNHLSFRRRRIYSNLTLNETYKSMSFRTNVRNLICFLILLAVILAIIWVKFVSWECCKIIIFLKNSDYLKYDSYICKIITSFLTNRMSVICHSECVDWISHFVRNDRWWNTEVMLYVTW